ncbi:hypothetical protein Nepgr_030083 [Nepenthes gracilis]|uniref:Uncharacterized protein n=1 Tax=Nepenthes gracilis TaxID=150966 RepID=A0AAD3TER1_NEPGR|nr:hypothetical protein Nepgr_030083 [Nepenthes gracilis]
MLLNHDPNDYLERPDLAPAAHPMGDGPILPPSYEFSSLDKSSGVIPNGLPLSSCLDVGGMSSSASEPSPSPKSNTSSPKSLRPASCPDNNVKQCPPPIPESIKVASPRAKSNKHHAPCMASVGVGTSSKTGHGVGSFFLYSACWVAEEGSCNVWNVDLGLCGADGSCHAITIVGRGRWPFGCCCSIEAVSILAVGLAAGPGRMFRGPVFRQFSC